MALRSDKVHAELKVTDEQKQKLTGLLDAARQQSEDLGALSQEERQAKMAEMMDKTMADVGAVMDTQQMARLEQIGLQLRGVLQAADMPRVREKLQLTDAQNQEMEALRTKLNEAMRNARGQGGSWERIRQLRNELTDAAAKLLTEEQRKAWDELIGAPFDVSQLFQRPGGANR